MQLRDVKKDRCLFAKLRLIKDLSDSLGSRVTIAGLEFQNCLKFEPWLCRCWLWSAAYDGGKLTVGNCSSEGCLSKDSMSIKLENSSQMISNCKEVKEKFVFAIMRLGIDMEKFSLIFSFACLKGCWWRCSLQLFLCWVFLWKSFSANLKDEKLKALGKRMDAIVFTGIRYFSI